MSELHFVETDSQQMMQELLRDFETYTGEVLAPGDARRIFLQGFGYVLAGVLRKIDLTGRANLLEYAFGEYLDALGELYGVTRLPAQRARTTLRFTLASVPAEQVVIPAGTSVSPDGTLFFETRAELVFPAGTATLSQSVTAEAAGAGPAYNGFLPGQITRLEKGVPFLHSVSNTVESTGGTETEADQALRERIRLAPFGMAVAGPRMAYEYFAKSASPDIMDVAVYSPNPGYVDIAVVKQGGVVPEQDDPVMARVLECCNARERRPLTDHVEVVPAAVKQTALQAEYYIAQENAGSAAALQAKILAAVEEYKAWQCEKLGRDINPDQLRKRMLNAGANRVNILSPALTTVGQNEIPAFTSMAVTYKGVG